MFLDEELESIYQDETINDKAIEDGTIHSWSPSRQREKNEKR